MAEERPQINIYIEVTNRGPRIRDGRYLYLLEFIRDGVPLTREGTGNREAVTENQLVLEAMIEAFKRIKKSSRVVVFTRCGHVLSTLRNHWPKQWEKNGWINAKGRPVNNAELWKELLELMEPHVVLLSDEQHSYQDWMLVQLSWKEKG